jgi:hypothetical protein
MKLFSRFACCCAVAAALVGAVPLSTMAGITYTWTGTASGAWSNPNNWNPFGIPGTGDSLSFPSGASNLTMTNDLAAGTAFAYVEFVGPYSVSGNAIALTGDMVGGPYCKAPPPLTTIGLDIDIQAPLRLVCMRLDGKVTVHADGVTLISLNIYGTVDVQGSATIDYDSFVYGALAGSGPVGVQGYLFGTTGAYNGTISASSPGSDPTTFINVSIPLATVSVGKRLEASGSIGNLTSFGLVAVGHAYVSNVPGFLSTGNVVTSKSVNSSASPGFVFVINGTNPGVSYSQVAVAGTITLDPNTYLSLAVGSFVPPYGQEFVLFSNDGGDPVSGTFATLPEGALLSGSPKFRISYKGGEGNDISVRAVTGNAVPVATDLNHDARSDLLWRNATTGEVYRQLMNGMTIVDGAPVYSEPDTNWKIVADGDFNADGITDLLWRNSSTGWVYLMPFDANGHVNGGSLVYNEPSSDWKIVQLVDINGDTKSDILWWNAVTGQVYAMIMNGPTILAQGFVYTEPNTDWKIVASGDFAGGGLKNQVLWRNGVTGQVYLMTLGFSSGAFTQTGRMIYQEPDTNWQIVAAADFDGDGMTDILWRNAVTGQVYMMLMNGGTIRSQGPVYQEPNLAWKIVAAGDYNGDGKADILWRNDSTGQLWMELMNGFAITSQGSPYTEPNPSWRLLGPREYGLANGTLGP